MDSSYLSMDSPLGRGLMGKALDDEVTVELPGGAATFTVAAISYTLTPPEGVLRPPQYTLKPPERS